MVHAYVMVAVASGQSPEVVTELREFDDVTEAHIIAGEWDVVAELDAEKVYDLLRTVSEHIGNVEGVGATRTYIVLE